MRQYGAPENPEVDKAFVGPPDASEYLRAREIPESALRHGRRLAVDRWDLGEGRVIRRGDVGAVDEGAPFDFERRYGRAIAVATLERRPNFPYDPIAVRSRAAAPTGVDAWRLI
jgi:hypothetical protein